MGGPSGSSPKPPRSRLWVCCRLSPPLAVFIPLTHWWKNIAPRCRASEQHHTSASHDAFLDGHYGLGNRTCPSKGGERWGLVLLYQLLCSRLSISTVQSMVRSWRYAGGAWRERVYFLHLPLLFFFSSFSFSFCFPFLQFLSSSNSQSCH